MMTDARIDSLAWGCLLTTVLHINRSAFSFKHLIGYIPFAAALVGLAVSFLIRDEAFRYTLRFTVQGAIDICANAQPLLLAARLALRSLFSTGNHSRGLALFPTRCIYGTCQYSIYS